MAQLLLSNGAVSAKESKVGKADPSKKKKDKKKEEDFDPLAIEKKIWKMDQFLVPYKLVYKKKYREILTNQEEAV